MANDEKTGRLDSPRYVAAVAAIIGGIIGIVKGLLGGLGPSTDMLFFWIGLGLLVLGIVAIPLFRWMAKKGL